MSDLDLDIHNYTLPDLEKFFRFNNSSKYSANDVEVREVEIREQLLQSGHIHKKLKRDLIDFLEKVKNRIIHEKGLDALKNKKPSTLPSKPALDSLPKYPSNISYAPSNVREGEIQYRPETNYTFTQNSDFLPGVINPIKTRTLTRCISIDTRFRDNAYTTQSSDFAINIPNKIQKVVSIQLSSIEFSTSSLYNISSSLKNHYLYIRVESTKYDEEFMSVFFLPDGRYTPEKLIATLNDFFKEKKNTPYESLKWMIDPFGSGKAVLEASDDTICSISLDFSLDMEGNPDKHQDYFSRLGRILGFTRRKYSGDICYVSETAINPDIAFSYFFLAVDDYQNNFAPSFVSVFPKNNVPISVLARISLDLDYVEGRKGENKITFISEPRRYFGPIDLTRIQIRLLDIYGRVIDMNGADYSFCLLLHVLYDV